MRWPAFMMIALLGLALQPATSMAETIHLKGGGKVVGTIVEHSESSVKISVPADKGTAIVTIARTRIDRIEEATTFAERLKAANDQVAAGEHAKAEEALRELLKMDPRHGGARRALADALYGQYRYEEATKTLEHYVLLVPTGRDPELLLQLAQYYLEALNYRDARRIAREAADLYPENRDLSAQVEEFLKRVERLRSGTDQLKERETAEKAETRKRRDQRATFDKTRGSNLDAQRAAEALQGWTYEHIQNLVSGAFVEAGAPMDAMAEYQSGADEKLFQEKVTRALATVRVDETLWLAMFDHQKAIYMYGWHYQLRARYPRTNPMVTVVCTVREGNQDKDKNLARATWDGRKQQVAIDRWTRDNREPGRPIRRVVK